MIGSRIFETAPLHVSLDMISPVYYQYYGLGEEKPPIDEEDDGGAGASLDPSRGYVAAIFDALLNFSILLVVFYPLYRLDVLTLDFLVYNGSPIKWALVFLTVVVTFRVLLGCFNVVFGCLAFIVRVFSCCKLRSSNTHEKMAESE